MISATPALSAPSHQKDNLAAIPDYIQYWLPIAPSDRFLFAVGGKPDGIKAADITKCPLVYLKMCQVSLAKKFNLLYSFPERPRRRSEHRRKYLQRSGEIRRADLWIVQSGESCFEKDNEYV
jgi:hypothetical protein